MQILKQVAGLDISKDNIAVCFGLLYQDLKQSFSKIMSFKNNQTGHKELLKWVRKQIVTQEVPIWFVMEATGIYYENLAYFLTENDCLITVLLPNKAKHFMGTLDNKSKTDGLDALALSQFGIEKNLKKWQIPDKLFKELKALCREYQTIKSLSTEVKNRLHAKEYSFQPSVQTIKRLRQQLALFKKQIKELNNQIAELVKQNQQLYDKIKRIQKIEGVGFMTLVSVISETNGFALIENGKQLTSYSGLDIVHNQSGNSIRKTKISKKGNSFIRNALYMPALSAVKYNQKLKQFYIRLVIKKNLKKVALIAVMRKLLLLIYSLWKNDAQYVPNYNIA
jgi:transposase